ncbi:tetratricopeptide repeat protein [Pseudoduganella sp. OTU4001]|uniref:tetratricopeptide repeat protein n=1 Tax=Pseudoduganella sp. OTU4001 TaxID=3043854 RepID=UPI00313B8336
MRKLTLVLALGTLAACSVMPLAVDTTAKAPVLDGFGSTTLAAGNANEAARQLFAQGVAQAYGFNEAEAIRSFKAALAKDPGCAMCAWGVAWQLGPNINNSSRGNTKEAMRYVDYAVRHSKKSTPHEQALIQSLALRYGHDAARSIAPPPGDICTTAADESEPVNQLDAAYAAFLRDLAASHPDDPDLLSLYAEAEMIITRGARGAWWDSQTGKPAGRIGELATQLEKALALHPNHTGLNHYMVHAADSVHAAKRAEAAADRLAKLAPKSPHLLHMPSHTYAHLGRFSDATRVNQAAVAADVAMAEDLKKQGFSNTKDWRGHNLHFQWYAALMEGRADLALETARTLAARSQGAYSFHEYVRSLPMLTNLHLRRWDAVLAEAEPKTKDGIEQALSEMARGIAYARLGKMADAKAANERIKPLVAKLTADQKSTGFAARMTRSLGGSAGEQLAAEIAFQDGQFDAAIALQEQSIKTALNAERSEPPALASGPRLRLGDMQLRAKRYADAEKTFRADLAERPKNGWALDGLHKALTAQGKATEAATVQQQLALSWAAADKGA